MMSNSGRPLRSGNPRGPDGHRFPSRPVRGGTGTVRLTEDSSGSRVAPGAIRPD